MNVQSIDHYARDAFHSPRMRFVAALAWTAFISVLLVQPSAHPVIGPAAPPGPPSPPRELLLTTGHLVAFSVLTLLWWLALYSALSHHTALALSIIIAVGLGFITEYLQSFVPDRASSWTDMLANIAATCLMAYFIHTRIVRLSRSRG